MADKELILGTKFKANTTEFTVAITNMRTALTKSIAVIKDFNKAFKQFDQAMTRQEGMNSAAKAARENERAYNSLLLTHGKLYKSNKDLFDSVRAGNTAFKDAKKYLNGLQKESEAAAKAQEKLGHYAWDLSRKSPLARTEYAKFIEAVGNGTIKLKSAKQVIADLENVLKKEQKAAEGARKETEKAAKIKDAFRVESEKAAKAVRTYLNSVQKAEINSRKFGEAGQQVMKDLRAGNIDLAQASIRFADLKDKQISANKAATALEKQFRKQANTIPEVKAALVDYANKIRSGNQDVKAAETHLQSLTNQFQKAPQQMSGFQQSIHSVANSLETLTNYLSAGLIIERFFSAIGNGISVIFEYDQGLKNLQAITASTDTQTRLMGQTIEQVAQSTKFSVGEVADGMRLLGQSGLSASESIDAIQHVSTLATGTLSGFQEVADLVTTTLRAFNKSSVETGRITDIMASAVNRSKLSIEKLRTAFNYVGAVASQANVSLEQTAASLAILSNNGLRASTIGTNFRQVISRLLSPTWQMKAAFEQAGFAVEELNPAMQGYERVLNNLSTVLMGTGRTAVDMSKAFQLFGLRGAGAAAILVEAFTSGKYDRMLMNMYEVGTAAEMAAKQQEGLEVKLKNLKDRFGLLAVELGKGGLIDFFGQLIDVTASATDKVKLFLESMAGTVIANVAAFVTVLGALAATLRLIGGAIVYLKGIEFFSFLKGWTGAIIALVSVIGGLIVGLRTLESLQKKQIEKLQEEAEKAGAASRTYAELAKTLQGVAGKGNDYRTLLLSLIKEQPELTREVADYLGVTNLLVVAYQDMVNAVAALQRLKERKEVIKNVEAYTAAIGSIKEYTKAKGYATISGREAAKAYKTETELLKEAVPLSKSYAEKLLNMKDALGLTGEKAKEYLIAMVDMLPVHDRYKAQVLIMLSDILKKEQEYLDGRAERERKSTAERLEELKKRKSDLETSLRETGEMAKKSDSERKRDEQELARVQLEITESVKNNKITSFDDILKAQKKYVSESQNQFNILLNELEGLRARNQSLEDYYDKLILEEKVIFYDTQIVLAEKLLENQKLAGEKEAEEAQKTHDKLTELRRNLNGVVESLRKEAAQKELTAMRRLIKEQETLRTKALREIEKLERQGLLNQIEAEAKRVEIESKYHENRVKILNDILENEIIVNNLTNKEYMALIDEKLDLEEGFEDKKMDLAAETAKTIKKIADQEVAEAERRRQQDLRQLEINVRMGAVSYQDAAEERIKIENKFYTTKFNILSKLLKDERVKNSMTRDEQIALTNELMQLNQEYADKQMELYGVVAQTVVKLAERQTAQAEVHRQKELTQVQANLDARTISNEKAAEDRLAIEEKFHEDKVAILDRLLSSEEVRIGLTTDEYDAKKRKKIQMEADWKDQALAMSKAVLEGIKTDSSEQLAHVANIYAAQTAEVDLQLEKQLISEEDASTKKRKILENEQEARLRILKETKDKIVANEKSTAEDVVAAQKDVKEAEVALQETRSKAWGEREKQNQARKKAWEEENAEAWKIKEVHTDAIKLFEVETETLEDVVAKVKTLTSQYGLLGNAYLNVSQAQIIDKLNSEGDAFRALGDKAKEAGLSVDIFNKTLPALEEEVNARVNAVTNFREALKSFSTELKTNIEELKSWSDTTGESTDKTAEKFRATQAELSSFVGNLARTMDELTKPVFDMTENRFKAIGLNLDSINQKTQAYSAAVGQLGNVAKLFSTESIDDLSLFQSEFMTVLDNTVDAANEYIDALVSKFNEIQEIRQDVQGLQNDVQSYFGELEGWSSSIATTMGSIGVALQTNKNHLIDFGSYSSQLKQAIQTDWRAATDSFSAFNNGIDAIISSYDRVRDSNRNTVGDIRTEFNSLITSLRTTGSGIDSIFSDIATTSTGTISDLMSTTETLVSRITNQNIDSIINHWETFQNTYNKILQFGTSTINALKGRWQELANKIQEIQNQIIDIQKDTADTILDIERGLLSEIEKWQFDRQQFSDTLGKAEKEAAKGNFELAEELYAKARQLAKQLVVEITDAEGNVIKSAAETSKIAIDALNQVAKSSIDNLQNHQQAIIGMQSEIGGYINQTLSTMNQVGAGFDTIQGRMATGQSAVTSSINTTISALGRMNNLVSTMGQQQWFQTERQNTQIAPRPSGQFGFAKGGMIPGYGGGDRHPILAESGEFVEPKETVKAYGTGIFEALRQKAIPTRMIKALMKSVQGFQDGGLVSFSPTIRPVQRVESQSSMGSGMGIDGPIHTINLNINNSKHTLYGDGNTVDSLVKTLRRTQLVTA